MISERPITHSEILLRARVLGGLKIIDRGEADDKIVAVLDGDYVWGGAHEVDELPAAFLERIEHCFSTYKSVPGEPPKISVVGRCGYHEAAKVIEAAIANCRAAALVSRRGSMEIGAPDWIRTSDLQLRRLPLYPTELRARREAADVRTAMSGRGGDPGASSGGSRPPGMIAPPRDRQ